MDWLEDTYIGSNRIHYLLCICPVYEISEKKKKKTYAYAKKKRNGNAKSQIMRIC